MTRLLARLVAALLVVVVPAAIVTLLAAPLNLTGTWQPKNWTLKIALQQDGTGSGAPAVRRDFWFRGQGTAIGVLSANNSTRSERRLQNRAGVRLTEKPWHVDGVCGRTTQPTLKGMGKAFADGGRGGYPTRQSSRSVAPPEYSGVRTRRYPSAPLAVCRVAKCDEHPSFKIGWPAQRLDRRRQDEARAERASGRAVKQALVGAIADGGGFREGMGPTADQEKPTVAAGDEPSREIAWRGTRGRVRRPRRDGDRDPSASRTVTCHVAFPACHPVNITYWSTRIRSRLRTRGACPIPT